MWSLVVTGGDFLQLQFIGARVVGRSSELRGGRFSDLEIASSIVRSCNWGILAALRKVVASQRGH